MAKQGMKRPSGNDGSNKKKVSVGIIQGKAKSGKERANPIIAGTEAPSMKVYHARPHAAEAPISKAYPMIDNDLARDNVENDLTAADLQDL